MAGGKNPVGGVWRCFPWKRLHPAAEMVIYLLKAGEGWHVGEYHLVHRRCNVAMWIQDRWYGFDLVIDGTSTLSGRKVSLDWWSKRVLIHQVKAFLSNPHTAASTEVAALARRVAAELSAQAEGRLPALHVERS